MPRDYVIAGQRPNLLASISRNDRFRRSKTINCRKNVQLGQYGRCPGLANVRFIRYVGFIRFLILGRASDNATLAKFECCTRQDTKRQLPYSIRSRSSRRAFEPTVHRRPRADTGASPPEYGADTRSNSRLSRI